MQESSQEGLPRSSFTQQIPQEFFSNENACANKNNQNEGKHIEVSQLDIENGQTDDSFQEFSPPLNSLNNFATPELVNRLADIDSESQDTNNNSASSDKAKDNIEAVVEAETAPCSSKDRNIEPGFINRGKDETSDTADDQAGKLNTVEKSDQWPEFETDVISNLNRGPLAKIDPDAEIQTLRQQLDCDSDLRFSKANKTRQKILELRNESARLTQANNELKKEHESQEEELARVREESKEKYQDERKIWNERMENISNGLKEELNVERLKVERLVGDVNMYKDKEMKAQWRSVNLDLKKIILERKLEESILECEKSHMRETATLEGVGRITRELSAKLEELEEVAENIKQMIKQGDNGEQKSVDNESERQKLTANVKIDEVMTRQGLPMSTYATNDNNERKAMIGIECKDGNNDGTSLHVINHFIPPSVIPSVSEFKSDSIRSSECNRVSQRDDGNAETINSMKSNETIEAFEEARRILIDNLKEIDRLMSKTEDVFIKLFRLGEQGRDMATSIETIARFTQFFVDELNLFLEPLRRKPIYNTSIQSTSDITNAAQESLAHGLVNGQNVSYEGKIQYEKNMVPFLVSKAEWRPIKDRHLLKELFNKMSRQWNALRSSREREVNAFIESRCGGVQGREISSTVGSFRDEYCLYYDGHYSRSRCIPLGRYIDNLVIVGTTLGTMEMWLKPIPYEERELILAMIPSVDDRLMNDIQAWKEVIEGTTDMNRVLRVTQLIDEKSFRKMKLEGKQFMPTTDTFRYLVEYLALAMQGGQRTVIIVCSYLCHLDEHDLQYIKGFSNNDHSIKNNKIQEFGKMHNEHCCSLPSSASPHSNDHRFINHASAEGVQILLSDFISASENAPNELKIETVSIRSLLNLSQLMKEGTELEIVLDVGGAGLETFWGMSQNGFKMYLDRLQQTARVTCSSSFHSGTVTIKRLLPLELADEFGCGQRDIDLRKIVQNIHDLYNSDKSLNLVIKCDVN